MKRPIDGKVDEDSSPEAALNIRGKAGSGYRLSSLSCSLARWWSDFSLEQRFTLVTALVVVFAMAVLGYWIERRVRASWTQSMAEVAATYVEAVVAPYLRELESGGPLSDLAKGDLVRLTTGTSLGSKVKVIKVWATNGELLFSTAGPSAAEQISTPRLARLLSGEVLASIDSHPAPNTKERDTVEVYAPVYDRASPPAVVAIAEFYNTTDLLNREIEQLKFALWLLIANVGLIVGVTLFALIRSASRTIAHQQGLLEHAVVRASGLARRNQKLRQVADRARIRAAVTNEEYLSRIGADLHDGPIQMLSLMMLRLPAPSEDRVLEDLREQFTPLIAQTLGELRNLSAGLVLPDIRDLGPLATIEAAISYHEKTTGTAVKRHLGILPPEMPEAIRICTFRVIQEALMNSYKHAEGQGQSVQADFAGGYLRIIVADQGRGGPALLVGAGLGLRGMRTRVTALRGSMSISRGDAGGFRLQVRLPVRIRSLSALIGQDGVS